MSMATGAMRQILNPPTPLYVLYNLLRGAAEVGAEGGVAGGRDPAHAAAVGPAEAQAEGQRGPLRGSVPQPGAGEGYAAERGGRARPPHPRAREREQAPAAAHQAQGQRAALRCAA
eukprot:2801984-Pyramimonas_sp.AAC.1